MASELIDAVPDKYGDVIKVSVTDDGVVQLGIPKSTRRVDFATPEQRDRFACAWMEACRRADGEPAAMEVPGQPAPCAYCEDDPDHPDPDNAGTCTCRAPGCGRGWCPKRDAAAELGQPGAAGEAVRDGA